MEQGRWATCPSVSRRRVERAPLVTTIRSTHADARCLLDTTPSLALKRHNEGAAVRRRGGATRRQWLALQIHADGLQAQESPHGLIDDPGHFATFRATVIFQGGVGRRGEVDRTPSSLASLPRHQSVSRCSAKRRRRRGTARDHGGRRMDVLRRLRAPIDVYGRFTRSVYRRLLTARNVPGCYELRGHSSSERWRASWRGG